ncbi:MAG: efflux RND transporter permease subunit [Methylotenera sp.]|nr:efflux RND transporter permease subunit [Methylotenera sp.]
MWFTQVSLRNPVFATMVMLALVVLGLFSFQRLKIDQFPNIDLPVVVVTTEYPGASPEIIESEVSKKIEEAVNSTAGISALTSRSYEGMSIVIVEFELTVNGRKAADDVREKVSNVHPFLRPEVKESRILRFDPASRPIWSLAVVTDKASLPAGVKPLSQVEMTNWADQVLKKRLENVRGVGSVVLVGGTKREINLYLNPQAMESLGITAQQVVEAVSNENQDLPVGSIRSLQQDRVVQVQGRMQRPEDFGNIIVARKGGSIVRLSQVARVNDGAQELENLALYNGERTLLLSVQKSQDENTIDVVDDLARTVADMASQLPPGVKLQNIYDGSRQIRVGVNNVRKTLIEGSLLTVLIVFLFLNSWRSTIITGLTLPIAIIGTFLFMAMFGFTINMITLMALSLCIGLLIDDAIVVRENIVRHVQMGKTAFNASMEGTKEIGLAVLATTFSIVAVFLPIGFMQGIIGKFFHEFGLTIVVAVLISMFVSFTLDPMLSSVWHDPSIHRNGQHHKKRSWYDMSLGRVTQWFEDATEGLGRAYQRMLGIALRHRFVTVLVALGIFITSIFMVRFLGTEFVPKADYSEASVTFYVPVGSSLQVTEAKAREVESMLRSFPEVRYTLSTINTGNANGKIYANVYFRLVDRQLRTLNIIEFTPIIRERLRKMGGLTVTHVGLLDSVGGSKQIEFYLLGPDQAELERIAAVVTARLQNIKGLVDIESSVKPNKPTVDITVKREAAADFGLGVGSIANQLRTLVAGQNVGVWRADNDQTYDVLVRLDPTQRTYLHDLERLPFNIGQNSDDSSRIVRLNQVAQVSESIGPNQVNRRELSREVAFSGNTYGRATGEVSQDIQTMMAGIALPDGYRYQFGGATKNMKESFQYAVVALAMGVIFIYMILASQFKSFLQPLALMTSLPLTLIGVVGALMVFRSTLSMFSVIGVIMLMGLVTKNAILLLDFAIRAREGLDRGDGTHEAPLGRTEALLLAAQVRLRPILMTTLAMVFGMIPLAFSVSEGSEQRAPLGQAVIGGVITSSILTLVVVPVVYCYIDDLSQWLKKLWHGKSSPATRPAG